MTRGRNDLWVRNDQGGNDQGGNVLGAKRLGEETVLGETTRIRLSRGALDSAVPSAPSNVPGIK